MAGNITLSWPAANQACSTEESFFSLALFSLFSGFLQACTESEPHFWLCTDISVTSMGFYSSHGLWLDLVYLRFWSCPSVAKLLRCFKWKTSKMQPVRKDTEGDPQHHIFIQITTIIITGHEGWNSSLLDPYTYITFKGLLIAQINLAEGTWNSRLATCPVMLQSV